MAGIPRAFSSRWGTLVNELQDNVSDSVPVVKYRKVTGEFASASAVASVLAVDGVARNRLPNPDKPGTWIDLNGRGILLLGLGRYITAMEVMPG